MEEFFTDHDQNEPQITQYQPPQPAIPTHQAQPTFAFTLQTNTSSAFDFTTESQVQPQTTFAYNQSPENDFNEFEEDETTKRIREDEQRLQNLLREKSQKEWDDKNEKITQGRKQLAEFQNRKEQEKQERARENVQKEQQLREQYSRQKVEDGWSKVVASINVRQGEHKGKKDVNRMREAILHRREDQTGK